MGLTTNSNEALKTTLGPDVFLQTEIDENEKGVLVRDTQRVQFESAEQLQDHQKGIRVKQGSSRRVSKGDTAEFPKEDEQLQYN